MSDTHLPGGCGERAGIFHHLITLPTYHTEALAADNLSKAYFGTEGMLGYVLNVQRQEIRRGVACVRHQNMAGSDIGDDHKEYFAGEAALKAGGVHNTMNQFADRRSGQAERLGASRPGPFLFLPSSVFGYGLGGGWSSGVCSTGVGGAVSLVNQGFRFFRTWYSNSTFMSDINALVTSYNTDLRSRIRPVWRLWTRASAKPSWAPLSSRIVRDTAKEPVTTSSDPRQRRIQDGEHRFVGGPERLQRSFAMAFSVSIGGAGSW